jgi:acyl-CoA synthetase (NDP forming)
MEKNTKILLGVLGVGVVGAYLFLSNKKKKQIEAQQREEAQREEARRIAEKQRVNDPERKKIYEDIYVKMMETILTSAKDGATISNRATYAQREAILIKYENLVAKLNLLSIDDLKKFKKYFDALADKNDDFLNDPFQFKEFEDFRRQHPDLGIFG